MVRHATIARKVDRMRPEGISSLSARSPDSNGKPAVVTLVIDSLSEAKSLLFKSTTGPVVSFALSGSTRSTVSTRCPSDSKSARSASPDSASRFPEASRPDSSIDV
jgi:hypothetical protein